MITITPGFYIAAALVVLLMLAMVVVYFIARAGDDPGEDYDALKEGKK